MIDALESGEREGQRSCAAAMLMSGGHQQHAATHKNWGMTLYGGEKTRCVNFSSYGRKGASLFVVRCQDVAAVAY